MHCIESPSLTPAAPQRSIRSLLKLWAGKLPSPWLYMVSAMENIAVFQRAPKLELASD